MEEKRNQMETLFNAEIRGQKYGTWGSGMPDYMLGFELEEMNGVTSLHIQLFLYKGNIMTQRIPWDIYEAVIMLNALISLYNGDISRKEAIESVSSELCERARAKGIEVDEFFRNTNGIKLQMSI